MKVLDLRCDAGHGFEGWFASEDDFLGQNARHGIECPICASHVIGRLPSAPRLNLGHGREPAPTPVTPPSDATAGADATQARWLHAVREVIARTEDVGERFPEEARRIHYGEVPERGIRGVATPEQREALRDEGIEVAALPLPAALKGPVQ